jgi:hypothetical protein
MKHMILATALLLGGALGAQADNDTWINVAQQPRGNDALHVDVGYCAQRVGPDLNGRPVSRQFKQCIWVAAGGSATRRASARFATTRGSIPTRD